MNIPDYILPVIGYRVWRWNATGRKSLNGEPWLPGRPLAAGCRAAARGAIVGRAKALHGAHELPHSDCTCGVYAAKNREHLRQFGYEQCGIRGEVYLWGTVVEHERGWRAQFAYPKSLFLLPDAIPFTLTETDARHFPQRWQNLGLPFIAPRVRVLRVDALCRVNEVRIHFFQAVRSMPTPVGSLVANKRWACSNGGMSESMRSCTSECNRLIASVIKSEASLSVYSSPPPA